MRYLVSAEEMRKLDQYTMEQIGIPAVVLMERAALCIKEKILTFIKRNPYLKKSVFIVAGSGNNGGDGLALARLLSEEGWEVDVLLAGNPEHASKEWVMQEKILKNYSVNFCSELPEKEYSVLVDALFGVGLSRNVEGKHAELLSKMNQMTGRKIAIDIPSGVDATTGKVLGIAFCADETITFAFGKRGLYFYPGCVFAGEVTVVDIGIPYKITNEIHPGMYALDEEPEELLPKRLPFGNKGTFGKVLLVAGSYGMAGAAVLAAKAAYRIGAGMVKVITAAENREIIQTALPEALFGTGGELEESLVWANIIAIGPGMGKSKEAKKLLEIVIDKSALPLVVDADALNILAENDEMAGVLKEQCANKRRVVLTPHPGELARLLHCDIQEVKENHLRCAEALASEYKSVVVAKDARTVICNQRGDLCLNLTGNSGMATAGSGDVLTGMIAGLIAQGMEVDKAACIGTYIHGCRGDYVSEAKGQHACIAGDLL